MFNISILLILLFTLYYKSVQIYANSINFQTFFHVLTCFVKVFSRLPPILLQVFTGLAENSGCERFEWFEPRFGGFCKVTYIFLSYYSFNTGRTEAP